MSSVITGDCLDIMAGLPAMVFDCCVTDPPYGDTSLTWDRKVDGWIEPLARVLKPAASIWVFGSMRFLAPLFSAFEQHGFKYSQDIVWQKQNGTGFHNDRFRRVHEHAAMFYRGQWRDVYKNPQFTLDATAKTVRRKTRPTHTGHIEAGHYISQDGGPRLMRSVIEAKNMHGVAEHPTQKPEAIVAPLLLYSCPPGGSVIDPFFGSGTVGVVAAQHGMSFTGIEIDAEYSALAKRRCEPKGVFG